MVRRRVLVRGHVQGVFFRDTCRQEAGARHVAGWVANCPDGSVEAVFEGEPDAVDAMVEWCHTGSRAATVDEVEVVEEEPQGATGFAVH